jgi:hypothetical protein
MTKHHPVLRAAALGLLAAFISTVSVSQGAERGAKPSTNRGECLGAMRRVLREGGFENSLDCKRDTLAIHRVGVISIGGHRYGIYEYEYGTPPVCPGCAEHGGCILVITRDGVYFGSYYSLDGHILVSDTSIIIVSENGDDVGVIQFTDSGPPKVAYYDGNLHELALGKKFSDLGH